MVTEERYKKDIRKPYKLMNDVKIVHTGSNCSLHLMAQVPGSSKYQVSQNPIQGKKKKAGIQKLEQRSVIPLHEQGHLHRLRSRKEDEFM